MSAPKIGDVVTAKVKAITSYGAWVAWSEDRDDVALVLIPDISVERIRHPGDVLALGQEVKARIVVVVEGPLRIRATIKGAEEPGMA